MHFLDELEAEAVFIFREVAATAERPLMLYSAGKDSCVLLQLARLAFAPAPVPFALLHVDTTWKFQEMYALRDRSARAAGMELIVHQNPDAMAQGINPFDHGARHTDMWKTDGLLQALEAYKCDMAIGGARRDEEKSRSKERIFSFRNSHGRWDPTGQRPELWSLFNTRIGAGESLRVFPLSNWTELDIWRYILAKEVEIPSLYFAKPRPSVLRDGQIIVVDDDRFRLEKGEEPQMRMVRFRTLGCYPLTAAVESEAATLEDILTELSTTRMAERAGRRIDQDSAASMEQKKEQGYF